MARPPASGSEARIGEHSVLPRDWGTCMNGVFDRWIERDDVGRVFVQSFDLLLGVIAGYPSTLCVHAETCGRALAVEHNGDVFACDHYVSPEYRVGNLVDEELAAIVGSDRQIAFGNDKRDTLPKHCRRCEFLEFCWGACPKDRIAKAPNGEAGLAYLCEGYRAFYRHTTPTFRAMARCLELGHRAADFRRLPAIEKAVREQKAEASISGQKVGRNRPCPCGSGAKFKRCCGA